MVSSRRQVLLLFTILLSQKTNAFLPRVDRDVFRLAMAAAANEEDNTNRSGGMHSYVEGGPHDDNRAEIEAMGGDPFFLDDDEVEEDDNVADNDDQYDSMSSSLSSMAEASAGGILDAIGEQRYATDGKGPTPKVTEQKSVDDGWEWNGIVNEDAHLGLD